MPERDVRLFLLDMLESIAKIERTSIVSTKRRLSPMTWRSMR